MGQEDMAKAERAQEIEVDAVLPPSGGQAAQEGPTPPPKRGPKEIIRRSFPGIIAHYLDNFLSVPNTKLKIGLDPIIGALFPMVGDALTAILGATILREGMRRGVPAPVLRRMAINILVNASAGAIPIAGDLFSIWFKSNSQNNALLQKHSVDPEHPLEKPSLWPIFLFLLSVLGVIGLVFFLLARLIRWIL